MLSCSCPLTLPSLGSPPSSAVRSLRRLCTAHPRAARKHRPRRLGLDPKRPAPARPPCDRPPHLRALLEALSCFGGRPGASHLELLELVPEALQPHAPSCLSGSPSPVAPCGQVLARWTSREGDPAGISRIGGRHQPAPPGWGCAPRAGCSSRRGPLRGGCPSPLLCHCKPSTVMTRPSNGTVMTVSLRELWSNKDRGPGLVQVQ